MSTPVCFLQIAGIFEFLGAMVLGGETTKTVASDITNLSIFKDAPEIYMYGMLCSVAMAGTWLLIATYMCLPVSTTHSISEFVLIKPLFSWIKILLLHVTPGIHLIILFFSCLQSGPSWASPLYMEGGTVLCGTRSGATSPTQRASYLLSSPGSSLLLLAPFCRLSSSTSVVSASCAARTRPIWPSGLSPSSYF